VIFESLIGCKILGKRRKEKKRKKYGIGKMVKEKNIFKMG